jgi:nitrous oxidase accessory protein NosD
MKNRLSRSFAVLFVVLLSFSSLIILNVKAESRTIIVPDDYSTIQEAISSANNGDTIFVKEGIYLNQSLIINKTLTLIGENKNTTILKGILTPFLQPSQVIEITSNNVEISGFTISESNYGIRANANNISIIGNILKLTAASTIIISGSNCIISNNNSTSQGSGFKITGDNNSLTGNFVKANSNSISVIGSFNTINQNKIDSANGIRIEGKYNVITNNIISKGNQGITMGSSSYSLIAYNNITNQNIAAIYIPKSSQKPQSSSHNNITCNYLADNGYGIQIADLYGTSENNIFYHNIFIGNGESANIYNKTAINYWDNGKEGNYWDDYNSTDNNRDGIGDTPYLINQNNIDNFPLMAPFDFENNSIVLPPLEPNQSEFPTTIVLTSISVFTVVGLGILVYFKKYRKQIIISKFSWVEQTQNTKTSE